jgi:23S rRNA pseudouridine1911/1915/1917 synthase
VIEGVQDDDGDDGGDGVADDADVADAAGGADAADAAPAAGAAHELAAMAAAYPGVDLGLDTHLDEHGQPRIVTRRFVVDEAFAGQRLDHYLKRMIPRLSRTRLQQIIRTQLECNGRDADKARFKPHSPVAAGEEWSRRRPARAEPPCPRTFGVLHDDDVMMVIDKPAGLPVHASAKFYFNTLTRVMAERYPTVPLQICHRLDRETSGVLVLAKSRTAAAALKGAFEHKRVRKTYLAIVHGLPPWPDDGHGEDEVIDYALGLVPVSPDRVSVRMEVRPVSDGGLPSTTLVRVLVRGARHALVRCSPITGRQHQIRTHLAAAGYPIVGDKLYAHGDDAFADYCARGLTDDLLARFELPRHALHAASIWLPHPSNGEMFRVDSPLAPDLRAFLAEAAGET